MALSTYFNWDTPQITTNSEIINTTTNFHEPTPPQQLFLPYLDESSSFNILQNTLFDPTCFLYPDDQIYPSHVSSYDPLISLSNISPTQDYNNLLPCPKRQKYYHEEEQELLDQHSNFYDGFVPNTFSFQPDHEVVLPEVELLYSEIVPEYFKVPQLPPCVGNVGDLFQYCEKKKKSTNDKTISAQSVAARERRRKITEKTQELGKLVPGGPKMNTAEMLHAATKYVKYLQAQVEMLQLMETLKENEAAAPLTEDLHALVVSPFVQEKLYSEEMCFVPKDFVTTLTNHGDVQSTPTILKDLEQLIGINIEKKAN